MCARRRRDRRTMHQVDLEVVPRSMRLGSLRNLRRNMDRVLQHQRAISRWAITRIYLHMRDRGMSSNINSNSSSMDMRSRKIVARRRRHRPRLRMRSQYRILRIRNTGTRRTRRTNLVRRGRCLEDQRGRFNTQLLQIRSRLLRSR